MIDSALKGLISEATFIDELNTNSQAIHHSNSGYISRILQRATVLLATAPIKSVSAQNKHRLPPFLSFFTPFLSYCEHSRIEPKIIYKLRKTSTVYFLIWNADSQLAYFSSSNMSNIDTMQTYSCRQNDRGANTIIWNVYMFTLTLQLHTLIKTTKPGNIRIYGLLIFPPCLSDYLRNKLAKVDLLFMRF